jgi:hypothetical protein
MSFGKMRVPTNIVSTLRATDMEGFSNTVDVVIASVMAAKEDRHGSEKWANMAAFSEATALFRFRKIPGLNVTTAHTLVCPDGRYRILSIEDVRGKGMYYECLADKTMPTVR